MDYDYEDFIAKLLNHLENNFKEKQVLLLLNDNANLIETFLGKNGSRKVLDEFLRRLSLIVFQTDKGKFGALKCTLEHSAMTNVYHHFINSNIMLRALQMEKVHVVKWLLSMDVSPYVQDENGMNALMYAVQNIKLVSFIPVFASDKRCLNQVDSNRRNALFYAVNCALGLTELLKYDIDINHRDENGDTILIYCCKKGMFHRVVCLTKNNVDVNATDHSGKTAAMYLAMQGESTDYNIQQTRALYKTIRGRYSFFDTLKAAGCNFNYINNNGESVLSLLLKFMYKPENSNKKKLTKYIHLLISLLITDCDFNIPIDEDGNTAVMVFLLVNDLETLDIVMKFRKDLDFSKKNKYGENATSIFMKNKSNHLYPKILEHPTFDLDYIDPLYRNTLLMISAIDQPYNIPRVLTRNPKLLNMVNSKGESALIIACKAQNNDSVLSLLMPSIDINLQDHLGNTALYYAVLSQNPIAVYHLIQNGADRHIKNGEGQSASDIALKIGNSTILEVLNNNITLAELEKIAPKNQTLKEGLELQKNIKEYLYKCITTTEYANFELTPNMISTEKAFYKELKKQMSAYGKFERIMWNF